MAILSNGLEFSFKRQFHIGPRIIGAGHPVLVIAEAGVNHFGNMKLAIELVELAAAAGADVFKTQFFNVDQLVSSVAPEWRDRLRPRMLSLAEFSDIKSLCDERGLIFMATAHDELSIELLERLEVPAVKIGSGEKNNPSFVRKLARLGKPILVSTGMYTEQDVVVLLELLANEGWDELVLLHCVTSYPVPDDQINLLSMDQLRKLFNGPVGYSDHSRDGMAVLAAVAKGANVVERHITTVRNVPNAQDWVVSSGPEDFSTLVNNIRRVESMLGNEDIGIAECEKPALKWALKSLVAARDLPEGHVIAEGDIVAKRPGSGIRPSNIQDLIGKRLKHSISSDSLIYPQDIE